MSGPKVVRVRSREELAAECFALIDGLRVSIEQCQSFARHHEAYDEESARRHAALLAELVAQTEVAAFDTVRRRCAETQDSVQFEHEALEGKVVGRAAAEATRKRREKVISQMGDKIGLRTEDLGRVVEATEEQWRLAEALGRDDSSVETIARHDERLERLTAEIRVLDATQVGNALLARAIQLPSEGDTARYKMKMDSLGLEWAQRRREIAALAQRMGRARKAILSLARISDEAAQAMRRQVEVALAASDAPEALIAEVEAFLASHAQAAAAMHRRRAVLQGLAQLGYEVRPDLITATPVDGRIVVKKPAAGYGVEVMMPEGAPRFQVKVVAFKGAAEARSLARDRDAETSWCSEFSKLQSMLKKNGADLTIEQAKGIGAVPVTEVVMADTEDRRDDVRKEQTRTL
jgi:hypothetical protein